MDASAFGTKIVPRTGEKNTTQLLFTVIEWHSEGCFWSNSLYWQREGHGENLQEALMTMEWMGCRMSTVGTWEGVCVVYKGNKIQRNIKYCKQLIHYIIQYSTQSFMTEMCDNLVQITQKLTTTANLWI